MTKKDVKLITGALIIIMIAVIISLVYAAFTGQLNITGTAVQRSSNWDIHFENLSTVTTTGSAKVLSQPSLDGTTTIEDYSVSTTSPGDTISFTFKVVNAGNYNASISSVSVGTPTCTGTDSTSNTNVCNKLSYTLTYENGASVQTNDVLYAKDYQIMKVTLTYAEFNDPSLLPTADVSISGLGITINYEQSGSALVNDNGTVANYRVYHQGEKITLYNEDYWVITDSGAGQDYVVALKENPLTANEITAAGGTATGTTYGKINKFGLDGTYETSDIKSVVDSWSTSKFINNELKKVDGYSSRLITKIEYEAISSKYSWRYNSNYWYWTMTRYTSSFAYGIYGPGYIDWLNVSRNDLTVRPVINVYKSALETNNNNNNNNNE